MPKTTVLIGLIQTSPTDTTFYRGFTFDPHTQLFQGVVEDNSRTRTICVRGVRFQRAFNQFMQARRDIRVLFDPAYWLTTGLVDGLEVYFFIEPDEGETEDE